MRQKKMPILQQGQPAKATDKPLLAPAKQQQIAKLLDRTLEKNRLKLKQSKETGKLEPTETNPGLMHLQLTETSGMVDVDAASLLLGQVMNTHPHSDKLDNANGAIAMLQGINPNDELEGLLAGQMVAVHNMAMEYARRAMGGNLSMDQANSLVNRTTKLMNVFTRQVEALQKYRTKGQQKITVQHVQVSDGGQAIIGDIHTAEGSSL